MSSTPLRKETSPTLVAKYTSIIKGKTILTTGASPASVGGTFNVVLAAGNPALLILAGRNLTKLQQTADAIAVTHPSVPTRLLQLDLSSLDGARKAAKEVNSWSDVPKIDVLVNNAGIMAVEYALSPEGIESQFMANHLAHFLFTNLIMDKILAAEAPRIVAVTSDGHRLGHVRFDDLNYDGGKTYNRWNAYGQSKTANILMILSLAEKLGKQGLLAYSLHPGLIITTGLCAHIDFGSAVAELSIYDRMMGNWAGFHSITDVALTPEEGTATHVYAAFDPDLKGHNGAYLQDTRVADPWNDTVRPWATSPFEAERLWLFSEELVGQKFSY